MVAVADPAPYSVKGSGRLPPDTPCRLKPFRERFGGTRHAAPPAGRSSRRSDRRNVPDANHLSWNEFFIHRPAPSSDRGIVHVPLRILIVEDEPLIALDLQAILEDAGHEVVGFATDLHRALEVASAYVNLDLALMDVDLAGGVDGVETARRLREEHDVAALFVSGRLTDEVRARSAGSRPVGFVGKPFTDGQILLALANLPERARS
ncbi:response regulator [Aureimonas leprariae]|uniref:Response regulator n=1 Tax=Plantimonas leprariae TaxID=2615207 RepID=A0A7V7PKH1_9HYPH|nr:response regulator [Aureimonas leprariae]KAB0676289.1 response regulator [Aureimonas leprariae]